VEAEAPVNTERCLQTCETCLAMEFRIDFHLEPYDDADILLLELFNPSALKTDEFVISIIYHQDFLNISKCMMRTAYFLIIFLREVEVDVV
jgi:hypothetical protein